MGYSLLSYVFATSKIRKIIRKGKVIHLGVEILLLF